MTKVLNILVEGATEKEFVSHVLYPYLLSQGISVVRPITMETSPGNKGGDIRYLARFKPNIQKILSGKEDLIVTSFIDFYRLRSDFPKYERMKSLHSAEEKVGLIEQGCFEDIQDSRFIPYIQLHEFEGLLFSSISGFNEWFPELLNTSKKELQAIINQFPNPEMINDTPDGAPSKRLERLIPNYNKPFYGNMIALENGISTIMEKCPRFNNWIQTLITRMKA